MPECRSQSRETRSEVGSRFATCQRSSQKQCNQSEMALKVLHIEVTTSDYLSSSCHSYI